MNICPKCSRVEVYHSARPDLYEVRRQGYYHDRQTVGWISVLGEKDEIMAKVCPKCDGTVLRPWHEENRIERAKKAQAAREKREAEERRHQDAHEELGRRLNALEQTRGLF